MFTKPNNGELFDFEGFVFILRNIVLRLGKQILELTEMHTMNAMKRCNYLQCYDAYMFKVCWFSFPVTFCFRVRLD